VRQGGSGGRAMWPTHGGRGERARGGVPADRRATPGRQRPEADWHTMCAVRALPTEQRGRGEADGWAAATVPGGGDADKRCPSGSGRGRRVGH
jgi:hypothetical protein